MLAHSLCAVYVICKVPFAVYHISSTNARQESINGPSFDVRCADKIGFLCSQGPSNIGASSLASSEFKTLYGDQKGNQSARPTERHQVFPV